MGIRDGGTGVLPQPQAASVPTPAHPPPFHPDPAAAVIGTRLHVAVAVSCVLMAFYVLVVK